MAAGENESAVEQIQSFITPERETLFREYLIFHAAQTGDIVLLKQLMKCGTQVNITDYDKRTPLHIAACEDKLEIVQCLCQAKVEVNARDRWGNTPLQNATMRRSYRVIQYLRAQGAELGKNGDLIQALAEAAVKNDIEQLALLLQTGASVNTPDFDGRTVLHKAASAGALQSVQFLVQHGAKLNAKDRLGSTPLDYAKENKRRSIVQILSHSYAADTPTRETNIMSRIFPLF
jgi:ankyrin repeat protein